MKRKGRALTVIAVTSGDGDLGVGGNGVHNGGVINATGGDRGTDAGGAEGPEERR